MNIVVEYFLLQREEEEYKRNSLFISEFVM